VLALPAPQLQLALPDNSTAAPDSTQRQAYDLISEHFGPGLNGPLVVLVGNLAPASAQQILGTIAASIGGVPAGTPGTFTGGMDDVAYAVPSLLSDGRTGLVTVIPESGPQEQATSRLVADLRAARPGLEQQTGTQLAVTGQTAVAIDVSDRLGNALLPFALVVVGLALILLLLVFRSILVPIKAAFGFLLSVAASFGAVVAVFQWGWLGGLLGVPATGPVISFLPVILMAVLFGLAMDYEVFLVSRMREDFVHGAGAQEATISGMGHGARVVTAAALIMTSVFAGFILLDDPVIKSMGFALAIGVAIDAFVVRMTIVPAVISLLGKAAWWLPGWLNRVLPNVDIEGERLREQLSAEPEREPISV
jgi:RND superfamily putative drug exporter